MEEPMANKTYALRATMALVGTSLAVFGIAEDQYKLASIGTVFIMGSFIFAILYLGTRRKPKTPRAALTRLKSINSFSHHDALRPRNFAMTVPMSLSKSIRRTWSRYQ
jgi:hypothetical protein